VCLRGVWWGNFTVYLLSTNHSHFMPSCLCFVFVAVAPTGPWPPYTRFLDHTQRRSAVCRTPLDEWSATTNIHTPVRFEPTLSAGEWPQTYALDRTATGIGWATHSVVKFISNAGCLLKNCAVSKINKTFISHLIRAKRTPSAAATVQVFLCINNNPSVYAPWVTRHTSTR
jgi:hypothetical protein